MCSSLIQPLLEPTHRPCENTQSDDRHGQKLGPQNPQADALQKYASDNNQKIHKRVQVTEPLDNDGHVGYGKNKTAEHEKWQQEEKGGHHGLLLRR